MRVPVSVGVGGKEARGAAGHQEFRLLVHGRAQRGKCALWQELVVG